MKAVLTLLFVLTFGVTALANTNKTAVVKVETVQMNVVLDTAAETVSAYEINTNTANSVARLYKFKNSRVKKALAFTTKRNMAKLA
ncbi:hypothetical protein [Costertonia aggregata]|uniref:Uncharacterized protein n=1 Tax=Costertonia aggregata TaxID=343403 RepID=A0A7H9ASN5_9FLAO|nr:hypothetical protein [Costertonia aggregata]QLG46362.1 hypothetical protein HYG79_13730 [Costertonia aggregata]